MLSETISRILFMIGGTISAGLFAFGMIRIRRWRNQKVPVEGIFIAYTFMYLLAGVMFWYGALTSYPVK